MNVSRYQRVDRSYRHGTPQVKLDPFTGEDYLWRPSYPDKLWVYRFLYMQPAQGAHCEYEADYAILRDHAKSCRHSGQLDNYLGNVCGAHVAHRYLRKTEIVKWRTSNR